MKKSDEPIYTRLKRGQYHVNNFNGFQITISKMKSGKWNYVIKTHMNCTLFPFRNVKDILNLKKAKELVLEDI